MSKELFSLSRSEAVLRTVARAPRLNVMLMATIEHAPGSEPTRHRVRDLSTTGARIDNAEKLSAGQTLQISIGTAQTITANIKWVRQGAAGLSFEEAVDIDAARKSVATKPKSIACPKAQVPSSVPTEGWFSALKDPYRN